MSERRRLPVLQEPERDDASAEEPRPPWHWVGFGTVMIFTAWLPLSYAAQFMVARVLSDKFGADANEGQIAKAISDLAANERTRLLLVLALPHTLALAIASFAGGLIVGRFGPGTNWRHSALSGAITAVVAAILSYRSLAASWTSIVVLAVAIGFAAWGGHVGASRRMRG